jgi:hypothetical protein
MTQRRLAVHAPAGAVLAAWVWWATRDGGYAALEWAPVALALLALLAALVAGGRPALPTGPLRVVVLALAAGVAWNALSLLWAPSPATAWANAAQLFVYLAVAWVLALLPWRPGSALALAIAWSAGVAAVGLGAVVETLAAADMGALFPELRWAGPLGYANATAAAAALALPAPLVLAARPGLPVPAQAAAVAGATFLGAFALLPQSRAGLLGIVATVAVVLLAGPRRGRLALRLAIVAAAVLAALGPIVDVDTAAQAEGPMRGAFESAALAMALAVAGAAAAATALALAERRVRISDTVTRAGRRIAVVAVVLAAVAAAGAVAANAGRIAGAAERGWQDFRGGEPVRRGETRLLAVQAYQRSDYWRVAWDAFAAAPLQGEGSGGFEQRYDAERDFAKHSRYPHSIWFRAASENGVVGVALLLALLGAAGLGCLRAARAPDEDTRRVAAIALALGCTFLLHASVDFLEEFPAVVGPVLGMTVVCLALRPEAPERRTRASGRRTAAVALVAGAAAVAIALPWLSEREQAAALRTAGADPARALRAADRAAGLGPLDGRPLMLAGFIELERGRHGAARAAFLRALDREDGWLPHAQLGLLDAAAGRTVDARRRLDTAARMSRHEELVAFARERLAEGRPVDPVAVNRLTLDEPLYRLRPRT